MSFTEQDIAETIQPVALLAESYAVTTVAQYEDGAGILKDIKSRQKRLEEMRTGMTGPLNASLKKINDLFRGPAEQLTKYEGVIKRALVAFSQAQEAERRREQDRLEAEARREREKLAAQAAKAEAEGRTHRAEVLETRAAAVVAPVVEVVKPKVSGLATREVWHVECVDLMALVKAVAAGEAPLSFVTASETILGKTCRSLKGEFKAPGLRVWSTTELASGAQ